MTKKMVEELAKRALESGNPYKAKAVVFYIDMVPRYLYAGETMTERQIDEAYLETARKDIMSGYNERMVGYYDKWYRYTRADNGRAYDLGVREAVKSAGCAAEMHVIPCAG